MEILLKLIENALEETDSIKSLRDIVVQMSKKGMTRDEIYKDFLEVYLFFENNNRYTEAEILGDVMDMFTGWYKGRDLEIK